MLYLYKKNIIKKVISLICIVIFVFSNIGLSYASLQPSNTNPKHYLIGVKKDIDLEIFVTKKGWESKVQRKAKSINTVFTDLNLDELNSLKNDADVEFVEEDAPVKTTSIGKVLKDYPDVKNLKKDSETIPWGLRAIGANLSLEHKYDGNGVSIAVLDTGVAKHPDLKVKGGVSFVDGITSYVDDNGHGTHVAGTIAAQDNNFGIVGVAPKSDIYAVKVLDQDGSGSYSQVIEGIEWAIDQKVNIISMSFGGLQDSKALHDIITIANNKGILLVAAAGNRGSGDETEIYPALYPEVISVGAVAQTDKRASYSSTGAELDLVAPGADILSTTSDGEYGVMSGTSMAVPHVTGSVAVLWSENKKLSSADIKSMIYQSATPIGNTHEYGQGILNLAKALNLVNGAIPPIINDVNDPLNNTDKPIPSFDSKSKDIQFGAFKDKLLMLKQMAIDSNKISIAKEIDRKYNELLASDISLSKLPEELQKTSKDLSPASDIESQINAYYQTKAGQIRALEYQYQQAIEDFSSQIFGYDLAASFVIGDIYLNQPWDFDTPYSPGYEYTIRFTPTTTGTYQIFTGPYGGTGSSNDTYLELYTDSGLTNRIAYDDDSAGNLFSKIITTLNAGNSYYIKLRPYSSNGTLHCRMTVSMSTPPAQTITLNSPVDVSLTTGAFKVFSFTPSSTGTYQILTGPYGGTGSSNDTYLELYSDASLTNMITSDDDSGGNLFSKISTTLNSGSAYYIKLRPYSSSGAVQARLTVSMSAPPAQIITLNSPIDVDLATGAFKVFQFTPTSTGAYQLLTGPYGGTGSSNDTYLELYSDASLTNMITSDDDSAGNLFSKLSTNLNAGVAYYIKLRPYSSSGAVHARLSITKVIPVQVINLDTPVDTQVASGEYKIYKFTPTVQGMYQFYTGPYAGTGGSSDTYLELYTDQNLTNMIAYDDDSAGNLFSSIKYQLQSNTAYYLKFRGYNNQSASARLTVHRDDSLTCDWYYMEIPDENGVIKKIYLTDIGAAADIGAADDNKTVQAIVVQSGQTIGQQYSYSNGIWTTSGLFAGLPGGGTVASAGNSEGVVYLNGFSIRQLNLDNLKYAIMNKAFEQLGVASDSFEPDDVDYFLQGIKVGIDDNVTFGLQQRYLGLETAYDEYFFDAGKVITDASFLAFYTTTAGGSAGASAYLFAQAEVTATVGVVALAGGVTIPGGIILEVGSVGSLAGSAGCGIVASLATKAATNSNNLLMASRNARDGLPAQNAGTFRTNLSNLTGNTPANSHAHHNLPQKFAEFFSKFKNQGLNIHDQKYGSWVEKTKHLSEARAFNDDWAVWIRDHASATLEQVLAQTRILAAKYGYTINF